MVFSAQKRIYFNKSVVNKWHKWVSRAGVKSSIVPEVPSRFPVVEQKGYHLGGWQSAAPRRRFLHDLTLSPQFIIGYGYLLHPFDTLNTPRFVPQFVSPHVTLGVGFSGSPNLCFDILLIRERNKNINCLRHSRRGGTFLATKTRTNLPWRWVLGVLYKGLSISVTEEYKCEPRLPLINMVKLRPECVTWMSTNSVQKVGHVNINILDSLMK